MSPKLVTGRCYMRAFSRLFTKWLPFSTDIVEVASKTSTTGTELELMQSS